jgi:hypothetical protein
MVYVLCPYLYSWSSEKKSESTEMRVDRGEKELKSRINVSRVPSWGKKRDMEGKVGKFCGDSRDLSKSVKRERGTVKEKVSGIPESGTVQEEH